MLGSGGGEGLCLDHLGGCADEVDVPPPERLPGHFPFLQTEDEELEGPEEGPGTVCEISIPSLASVLIK